MTDEVMLQWFNEMNLMQSEKDARYRTAEEIKAALVAVLARQLASLLRGALYLALEVMLYDDEIFNLFVDAAGTRDDYIENRARKATDDINATTKAAVESVKDESLLMRIKLGQPVTEDELPKEVLEQFSEDRARRIAQHEANVIHNHFRHEKLAETNTTHTWVTMRDERVRLHHMDADGQTVPIDEPFVVMGEKLMFPTDQSLGATARNTVRCRCIEL